MPPRRTWTLGSGQTVIDRPKSHVHAPVRGLLPEVLSRINSDGGYFLVIQVDFDQVVGKSVCVEITDQDDTFWAVRSGRQGYTRFVRNRLPEDTNSVTVVLLRATEEPNKYVLITAFLGKAAEYAEYEGGTDGVSFWDTHAIIVGYEEYIEGSDLVRIPR